MNYQTYKTTFGQEYVRIDHLDGSTTCIPPDPANTDYQAYLAWLAKGNVPEPAEVTE
jgi:hypothetical protein